MLLTKSFDISDSEGVNELLKDYCEHIKQKPDLANRFEELRYNPVLKARETVVKFYSDEVRQYYAGANS